jgi:hypothetical protein
MFAQTIVAGLSGAESVVAAVKAVVLTAESAVVEDPVFLVPVAVVASVEPFD